MVTTIVFITLILLVTNGLTGFLVFKGVQLGLRWQLQVQEKKPPTLESPITQIVEQKQAVKQQTETENIMSEWLNGAVERR